MSAIEKAEENVAELKRLIAEDISEQEVDRAKMREAQNLINILKEDVTNRSRRINRNREDLGKFEDFLQTASKIDAEN